MIDDKKIEEASFEKTFGMYGESDSLEQGFICGAKWAINEFLKDLWHPASEKPNIKQGECCITCLVKFKNGSTELCV